MPDIDTTVRPTSFADYIGQREIIDNLKASVAAAKKARRALDHFLLAGPPGTGKTSLAQVIATEMGTKLHVTSGPAITHKGELISLLTGVEPGDVVFIDEIHRLPIAVQETLYSAMEDFKVDLFADRKAMTLKLARFTLLGATTHKAMLSAPLLDRFGFVWQLGHYDADDMFAIIARAAVVMRIHIEPAAIEEIACRSRGTPRIANRLLRRVQDYFEALPEPPVVIDRAIARHGLAKLGIDDAGLGPLERCYLDLVCNRGPIGVDAIASALGERRDAIEGTVEPFMVQAGFVERTTRGRIATQRGYQHAQIAMQLPRARVA